MPTNARAVIRVTQLAELIVGCPAKVPHLLANRPRPQHWTAARGTALHAAMQVVMIHRQAGRQVSNGVAQEVFSAMWKDEREKVEDWSFDGGTVKPAEVEARTLEMLTTLYLATKDVCPVAVELTLSWDIPDTDYTLQGTIDCPGEYRSFGLVIHDWKSAAKPWSRYKKAHQWQHIGYRVLLHHNRPELVPSRFWWWSVDEKTGEVQRIEHIYQPNVVEEGERQILGALRQLQAGYLPTKDDPNICKFCDWRSLGGC